MLIGMSRMEAIRAINMASRNYDRSVIEAGLNHSDSVVASTAKRAQARIDAARA